MWDAIRGVAGSKRFFAAVLSGIGWLVGRIGFDLDTEALAPAIAPLWLYIFGQSVSDFGKGKAQVEQPAAVKDQKATQ